MSFNFERNDDTTLLNSLSARDVIDSLSIEDVARFLERLGVQVDRFDTYLICPTICHNPLEEAETRKLYWYHNHKVFHCYTECNESMSIFELYCRYMSLNEYDITLEESELYVKQFLTNIQIREKKKTSYLDLNREKYLIDNTIQELDEYPSATLSYFTEYYHPLWLKEGISKEAMKKFGFVGGRENFKTYKDGKITLKKGDKFIFTTDDIVGDETRVAVSYKNLMKELMI